MQNANWWLVQLRAAADDTNIICFVVHTRSSAQTMDFCAPSLFITSPPACLWRCSDVEPYRIDFQHAQVVAALPTLPRVLSGL